MATQWLTRNSKMVKSSGKVTYNFDIPAYKSQSGFITCPFAGVCKNGCYAQMGTFQFSTVKNAMERRLDLTKSDEFVPEMIRDIQSNGVERVRIHASGDFYNREYVNKWLEIINACPDTEFYAYTKAFKLLPEYLPSNLTIIKSYGGVHDKFIDTNKDRHSRVFQSLSELLDAGYADASGDDSVAIGSNPKIGLVYHGYKSKGEVWKAS